MGLRIFQYLHVRHQTIPAGPNPISNDTPGRYSSKYRITSMFQETSVLSASNNTSANLQTYEVGTRIMPMAEVLVNEFWEIM